MRAYIAGVIASDGSLSRRGMKLKAKDREFVEAFVNAVNKVYGRKGSARPDGPYWRVVYTNKLGTFDNLRNFEPHDAEETAQWLRGYFDGDGNANLTHQPQVSNQAYSRRIAFYSTNRALLVRAASYLSRLHLPSTLRGRRLTNGHYGKKPLYELRLRDSQENFDRFARLVGSSINRKQTVLNSIPKSYQPPGHHARAWAKALATRYGK